MKENMFLWFVLMTVVSWGCYVPTVHEGQAILGDGKPRNGGYQAFVCISGAYLVIGLFVLAAMFFGKLEAISSNPVGFAYAFFWWSTRCHRRTRHHHGIEEWRHTLDRSSLGVCGCTHCQRYRLNDLASAGRGTQDRILDRFGPRKYRHRTRPLR